MIPSPRPRPLPIAQARRIVRSTSCGGIARAHGKGFAWLVSRLLPALNALERAAKTRKDRRWLSCAYYVVGDIHDFNHAPARPSPLTASRFVLIRRRLLPGAKSEECSREWAIMPVPEALYGARSRWTLKTCTRRATSPTWSKRTGRPRSSAVETPCGRPMSS